MDREPILLLYSFFFISFLNFLQDIERWHREPISGACSAQYTPRWVSVYICWYFFFLAGARRILGNIRRWVSLFTCTCVIHIYLHVIQCIYLFIYLYEYIWIYVYMNIWIYECTNTHTHTHTHTCACVCVCLCVCVYIYVHKHMYTYACIHICMCVCVRVRVCVCVGVCVCVITGSGVHRHSVRVPSVVFTQLHPLWQVNCFLVPFVFLLHTHTHMLNAVGKRQVPLCACVWVCMGVCESLLPTVCAPYCVCTLQYVCMGVYGCVWVCMGVYGCVWVWGILCCCSLYRTQ